VVLASHSSNVQWVLTALRTITTDHQNLQEVSLLASCILCEPERAIGEAAHKQWSEFDHILARLLELHSIRLQIHFFGHPGRTNRCCANSLLPEASKKGMVDLVNLGLYIRDEFKGRSVEAWDGGLCGG